MEPTGVDLNVQETTWDQTGSVDAIICDLLPIICASHTIDPPGE